MNKNKAQQQDGSEQDNDDNNTRIIVKGLPKHLTNPQFLKHFQKMGEVTDAKIMYTKSGESRCFGFVGFKKPEQAKRAIKQTDNTFINMSKIFVSFAKPYKDESIDRPWSKYSEGSSQNKRYVKEKQERQQKKATVSDKQVKDFLGDADDENVPKDKFSFWSNDIEAEDTTKQPRVDDNGDEMDQDDEEEEEDQDEPSKKKTKKKAEKNVSDLDYLKSKIVDNLDQDEINDDDDDDAIDEGRLFVYNLSYSTSEDELLHLFKPFGEVSEIHIPIDKDSKKSKGVAFVLFLIPENAVQATTAINNTNFQGRLIYVVPAKRRQKKATEDTLFSNTSSTSYKKKLEQQRKATANSSHNWNSLFMRSDTVADSISQQIGIDKRQLLIGDDVDNAAVRLALGETEIIKQTKQELTDSGINLEALSDTKAPRSKTVIMVKNLPFEKSEDIMRRELMDLFSSRGGQVSRVIVPESRAVALIEFHEPNDARIAFRANAYRQFHRQPLYLEWAPVGLVKEKLTKKQQEEEKKKKKEEEKKKKQEDKRKQEENKTDSDVLKDVVDDNVENKKQDNVVRVAAVENEVEKESATLFIKNLNFSTKDEGLLKLFAPYNPRKASVAKTKNGTKEQSKGFGFVEFDNLSLAVKAHDAMQGATLDNHAIVVQYSSIQSNSAKKSQPDAKEKTTFVDEDGRVVTFKKIVVRNVAFEATRQDIQQLFSAYGELKTVRLPTKQSGDQHRGFAFVEFVSPKECNAAYEALKNTHLYGRRLVLEYAADDDNLDVQREKMNEQFKGKSKKRTRNEAFSK
ncbi:RNA-binding protein 19 [Acrasis kona]|uniref:RNA-binding protein 19 n=1 Tax=Acrasis kona TaxID=1008807 RepID=A0AAW2ZKR0_9EUKA